MLRGSVTKKRDKLRSKLAAPLKGVAEEAHKQVEEPRRQLQKGKLKAGIKVELRDKKMCETRAAGMSNLMQELRLLG